MDIHVTARHCKLTDDEHKAAVDAALHFEKFHDNIIRIDAILDEDTHKSCEYTVRVHGHTIVARETTGEFTKAIHDAAEKVVRQLRKLKTRMEAPRETIRE